MRLYILIILYTNINILISQHRGFCSEANLQDSKIICTSSLRESSSVMGDVIKNTSIKEG